MFRRSAKKGNYGYTAARVKAKKALLLGEEDYNKMLQMTVPEISRYISESGYQKEMSELANRYVGIDLVEHATYQNMANAFASILLTAQGDLKLMIGAYLEKWDIWNTKVILRGRQYNLDVEQIREDLVPAGSISAESLEKIISLNNLDEVILACGKESGFKAQEALEVYKSSENLAALEDYLDKWMYANLLASINPSSRPTELFQDYVRMEIDIKNVETILKLKAEGIYGESVMQYLIPGGKQVNSRLASQLANAESISAMASDLSQVDFYEVVKELMDKSDVSARDVVAEMKKYEIAKAKKFSHLYPLSVIPAIDFMIHKEIEVRNIRTVARGIESGLDKETIKGLLVI